tara:strand:+ start:150 stop:815 length:666 start_codon:yes stop_codon:yes gene_type:complete
MTQTSKKINKKYLASLINRDSPTIFDVGCYDGRDSLEFLSVFKSPHIFAFDPLPNLTKEFKSALKLNKNFTLTKTALGNVDGFVDWHKSDDHPASNSMKTPKDHLVVFENIKFSKIYNIKCSRVDTWVEDNLKAKTIDLMWVDVNGAEREFLEGANQTTSEKVNFIFIEFSGVGKQKLYDGSYTKDEILAVLGGFEELGIYDFMGNYGNLLLRNRDIKEYR